MRSWLLDGLRTAVFVALSYGASWAFGMDFALTVAIVALSLTVSHTGDY